MMVLVLVMETAVQSNSRLRVPVAATCTGRWPGNSVPCTRSRKRGTCGYGYTTEFLIPTDRGTGKSDLPFFPPTPAFVVSLLQNET